MVSPLLSNAIDAIQLGVEDFKSGNPKRSLSAVRNISAGILLLFKEKLRALSPSGTDEVLIKERIRPRIAANGSMEFIGSGKKTVDVQQIKDRFESLGINADWKKFDDLVKLRNELEHYYSIVPISRVRELLADAFVVLHSFITEELHAEPSHLLGTQTWEQLTEESVVYDEALTRSVTQIQSLPWLSNYSHELASSFRCAKCGSGLLTPLVNADEPADESSLECTICGHADRICEMYDAALEERFGSDLYYAASKGGTAPVAECYECGRMSMLLEALECVCCGSKRDLTECAICGGPTSKSHTGYDLCDYHQYVVEKESDK